MANVKVRFACHNDDRRIIDVQLLSRASVKREFGLCPIENHFANLTPLRFCRYFNDNDARFVSGRILKGNVNVTVRFNFENNDAARQIKPFVFSVGARVRVGNLDSF
jgi:hypothetical protein